LIVVLILAKTRRQTKAGKQYPFYVLRENAWDTTVQATRQRYIAYVGVRPILTESKAGSICEAKGLTLDQLRAVKGLSIVPDEQPPKQRRREAKRKPAGRRSGDKAKGPAPEASAREMTGGRF